MTRKVKKERRAEKCCALGQQVHRRIGTSALESWVKMGCHTRGVRIAPNSQYANDYGRLSTIRGLKRFMTEAFHACRMQFLLKALLMPEAKRKKKFLEMMLRRR